MKVAFAVAVIAAFGVARADQISPPPEVSALRETSSAGVQCWIIAARSTALLAARQDGRGDGWAAASIERLRASGWGDGPWTVRAGAILATVDALPLPILAFFYGADKHRQQAAVAVMVMRHCVNR